MTIAIATTTSLAPSNDTTVDETVDSHESEPARRLDVAIHELDDEALVFDPESLSTHRLNETGLFIWRQCDGRSSASTIAARLCDQYEVSFEQARQCVSGLLCELARQSLLRGAASEPEVDSAHLARAQGGP